MVLEARSGSISYLDGIRQLQGVPEAHKPIHILIKGSLEEDVVNKSLPLFMQDLSPEERVFTFMINPSEMSKSYAKIINQFHTRGGWILEHISDDLPTMSLSGSTASFRDPTVVDRWRGPLGEQALRNNAPLDVLADGGKEFSIGFKNLIHLIDMYRNNGRVFFQDPFFGELDNALATSFSYAQRIQSALPIQIIYGDEEIYEGFFTAMSTSETAENPYAMDFEMTFRITRIYEYWRLKLTSAPNAGQEKSLSESSSLETVFSGKAQSSPFNIGG